MPLSPLQERIAVLIAKELEGTSVVLAGGASLVATGIVDRTTRDLDYFGTPEANPSELLKTIVPTLEAVGLTVEVISAETTFARLIVEDGNERTEIDFGIDARLFDIRETEIGPALATREAAVDKVLAIFGRTEPRDLVDLDSLLNFFSIETLFEDARMKDPGFDLNVFAFMIGRYSRSDRRDFSVSEERYHELMESANQLREQALSIERDRDRGLGFER